MVRLDPRPVGRPPGKSYQQQVALELTDKQAEFLWKMGGGSDAEKPPVSRQAILRKILDKAMDKKPKNLMELLEELG